MHLPDLGIDLRSPPLQADSLPTECDGRPMCVCLCVYANSSQSCLTICDLVDCSPPGSLVHGTLQAEHWSGFPLSLPGNLPNPGIKPTSLMSPELTGGFFTTRTTWEGLIDQYLHVKFPVEKVWLLTLLQAENISQAHKSFLTDALNISFEMKMKRIEKEGGQRVLTYPLSLTSTASPIIKLPPPG